MNVPARRPVLAALAILAAATLGGCDYVAQKKLIPGQHSEGDVRQLMGVPTMVWDRPDGQKDWDYVRGPQGIETLRVTIDANGRYQGMVNILTEDQFAKARPGMTEAELTRLLSRPTQVEKFPLKPEWCGAGATRRAASSAASMPTSTRRPAARCATRAPTIRRNTRAAERPPQAGDGPAACVGARGPSSASSGDASRCAPR